MKKALFMFAMALVAFASCQKQEEPASVEFAKSQYVLLADAPLEVSVTLSSEAKNSVSFPLTFAGTAAKGKDYTVSAESVSISAGSKSGSITITPAENYAEKTIEIGLGTLPEGYVLGANAKANVAVEAKEVLIYSFQNEKSDVLDKSVIKVNISGLSSGKSWVATENIDLPYKLEGSTDAVEVVEDAIKIAKGANYGTLTVISKDVELGSADAKVTLSVDQAKAGERFAAGTNAKTELSIKGVLKISSLLGTWNFGRVFGSDPDFELELWFEEMGDDSSLLPVNNEGFTLTFAEDKDEDGNVIGYKIIPGGEGDFGSFYRESAISWTAPIADNMTKPDGKAISDYCSQECNMFVASYDENLDGDELLTWFTIKANRNFDNSNENIADAAIAMRLDSEGNLVIHIKDYDQPPFGEMWWDPGYDPDMFAFASVFTKAE